jgi:nitrogen fixation-related uncharacterized protein
MGGDTVIPYIWAATGLVMLVVIVLMIHWAHAHGQFDEDIKNQIFSDGEDDRYGDGARREAAGG